MNNLYDAPTLINLEEEKKTTNSPFYAM